MKRETRVIEVLIACIGFAVAAQAGVVVNMTRAGDFTVRDADTTLTTEITRDFSDSVLLVDQADNLNNMDIYGGWSAQGATVESTKFFDRAGINAVAIEGRGVLDGGAVSVKALLLWDDADFISSGNKFDSSANSSFALSYGWANYGGTRFVIRDGSTYYLSTDHGFDKNGATIAGDTAGLQWASFTPAEYVDFDVNATDLGLSTLGTFSAMTFDNVTGVGFITEGDRGNNPSTPTLTINSFEVALIPEPATLGLIAAAGGVLLFIRRRASM